MSSMAIGKENSTINFLSRTPDLEADVYGFANATEGEYPYEVFGSFLCQGNIPSNSCQACVAKACHDIIQLCPGSKEAIIWRDECQVRYSNRSFFSTMETKPYECLGSGKKFTNPSEFQTDLLRLFLNISTQASVNPHKSANGSVESMSTSVGLYGVAQCMPDLSSADCKSCLDSANSLIPSCSVWENGGLILQPSCNTKYTVFTPFENRHLGAPVHDWYIVVVGSAAVVGIGVSICYIALIMWRRRKAKEERASSQEVQLSDLGGGKVGNEFLTEKSIQGENGGGSYEFPSMQLDIINAATNHFCDANKLGQGGFGPVYKGTLADGKEIAVKRLSVASTQGLTEFKNEVMLIAKLQHRNLVRLLGCLLEDNETLLVYEYMPNRSLDAFLFDAKMSVQLDWKRRFNIIKGIARGIMYLHEDSRLRIVHRDLKASNILLDGEMNPKVSDFGIARIFGGNQSEASTKRVVGTYGYMAPEYAMGGHFSFKSDVFSFGILLLEIISGKKNNGFHLHEICESLLLYAWKLWSSGQGMQLLDTILVQSCVETEVLRCIHIGLLCVQKDPIDRPTMSSVIVMLSSETITLPDPTEPATYFVRRVVEEPAQFPTDNVIFSVNQVTLSDMMPR